MNVNKQVYKTMVESRPDICISLNGQVGCAFEQACSDKSRDSESAIVVISSFCDANTASMFSTIGADDGISSLLADS